MFVLVVAFTSQLAAPAFAQELNQPAVERVADPWGRETPRSSVEGLVEAFAATDPSAVLRFLDLAEVPEARQQFDGRRLARSLERALDRTGGILPGYSLSSSPEGHSGDGLAPELDRFAAVLSDGNVSDLLLRRGEDEGRQVWRVAPQSLELVRALAANLEQAPFESWLPDSLVAYRIGGTSLAAWISIIVIGAGALIIAGTLIWTVAWGASRLLERHEQTSTARVIRETRLPLTLIGGAILFQIGAFFAAVPVVARATLTPIVEIGTWIAIGWLLWRIVHRIGDEVLQSMTRRDRLGAISVVSMVRRLAKALILAFAAILVANSLGLNLTGWLAALGLGGLAFALGAQKTIEHMVGGLSIIADQPIRIGDFCQIDGVLGTVEDIGLRSTRIRTLDRTLVTIPNGDLSAARIENYAGRDRFRWLVTVGLRYETSPEQMRAVIWQLNQLLAGDERIAPDHRARFIGFGSSSLDIEIFAYIIAADYPSNLAIREELNLAVMDVVSECGASFAFPSTTVYLEGTNTDSSKNTT